MNIEKSSCSEFDFNIYEILPIMKVDFFFFLQHSELSCLLEYLFAVWYYIWHNVVCADKKVTNSQWCHTKKWGSSCLQLPASLINSGSRMLDGVTAKQERFIESVSPVFFYTLTPSKPFSHLFPVSHVCCSPAATRAKWVKASLTCVTLLPRHADTTCTPSLYITLQTHWTWERQI